MEVLRVETRKLPDKGIAEPKVSSDKNESLKMEAICREEGVLMSWSSRIFHQPCLNLGILYIMGFKTKLNPDSIKAGFEQTLIKHPAFSSLQVVDEKNKSRMKWVRTQVNLEKHVIIPTLTLDTSSPDKVIENYISNLRNTPLDLAKPLWEFHILNLKTSEAEATGVFWIHHSLGDGTSLISLLLNCARKISDPDALPSLPRKKKREPVTGGLGRLWRWLTRVWAVLVVLWNTIVNVWSFVATLLVLKNTETPLRQQPGAEHAPRRFVYRTVSLEDIKTVKNVMNATVNDVVLGISQAALARYLYRIYEENKTGMKKKKKGNIPNKICLKAAVMVDIRPSPGVQALAYMMDKKSKAKWGNWVGFLFLPLNIRMRDDPLDYIRDAKAIIDKKKNTLEATITFYGSWLIAKFFGIKAVTAVVHKFWSRTTLTYSNVVGPVDEISLCGHPVAFLAPTAYGVPQALIIHFHSYVDKMTFALSVDERNIPNPHQLCDDIEESLKLMKKAVERVGEDNATTLSRHK